MARRRTLNDLTPQEMATFAAHLDALDSEIDRCRRVAASLLRGVRTDLSDVMAAVPTHPMSIRVREILATLQQLAGPRAELANGKSPSVQGESRLTDDRPEGYAAWRPWGFKAEGSDALEGA
jgi:hypothetical protein